MSAAMWNQDRRRSPTPRYVDSDTLELRINADKSILLYYTIYILRRVVAAAGKGVTTNEEI